MTTVREDLDAWEARFADALKDALFVVGAYRQNITGKDEEAWDLILNYVEARVNMAISEWQERMGVAKEAEKQNLLGEKTILEQLIEETPDEDLLDRGSLLTRLEDVQQQLERMGVAKEAEKR